MEHLPALLGDLTLILILAGAVGLLFKKLKQPLVLGYIVAGFLAGKHMPYMPSVEDTGSVETWSQIGVVFLMFTLGLEFSFKKIVKQGARPLVTACLVMFCMMAVGHFVGHLFGWSPMDKMFLGGMLAMSSTTIIFKAYSDLGLMKRKFAGRVLSVLVLEDILGILLMVMLSGVAVSQQLEGSDLVVSLMKLAFFLVLWFVVGMFVIPTFLRRAKRLMNGETLLIFSLACCFLMVWLAAKSGYSTAFGAFMMGSIMAETVEAERIERLVAPVKDLFGAIFFVSVGMLVNPSILIDYWLPILVLTVSIIVGQAILGTGCFLLTGHTMKTSVQCGFSLAQVGEFAFIIAGMGLSLGVTSDFLYPVIVAVSIITTFLTPYMIRYSQKVEVPALTLRVPLMRNSDGSEKGPWHQLLVALGIQTGVYAVLSVALIGLSLGALLLMMRAVFGHWPGNIVCGVLTLALVAPFLRAIVMRKNHSEMWRQIALRGWGSKLLLSLTLVVRFGLATSFVFYVLEYLSPYRYYWHWLAGAAIMLLFCVSGKVKAVSRQLESTFRRNLSAREEVGATAESDLLAFARLISGEDDESDAPVKLRHLQVTDSMPFCGKALRDSRLREDYGCQVVGLEQQDGSLLMPEADYILRTGDVVWLVGERPNLLKLLTL